MLDDDDAGQNPESYLSITKAKHHKCYTGQERTRQHAGGESHSSWARIVGAVCPFILTRKLPKVGSLIYSLCGGQ